MQFNSCKWIIESDIRKCFDTIDHDILLSLLMKKIKCVKTLNLIRSALEAGYFDQIGGKRIANELGTPQGSILSPLLCNIYLHEFDLMIKLYMESFNKGNKPKVSLEYEKRRREMKKHTPGSKEWKQARIVLRSLPSIRGVDPDFKRFYYVRYADDFLIAIRGHKRDAQHIVQSLNSWLAEN
jgi:retron-type reverse transcriptase